MSEPVLTDGTTIGPWPTARAGARSGSQKWAGGIVRAIRVQPMSMMSLGGRRSVFDT